MILNFFFFYILHCNGGSSCKLRSELKASYCLKLKCFLLDGDERDRNMKENMIEIAFKAQCIYKQKIQFSTELMHKN